MKVKSEREVAQSCPTLSDPMDCSLPDSSIHGIFQARVLEWGAIAFSGWTGDTHLIMCLFMAVLTPWNWETGQLEELAVTRTLGPPTCLVEKEQPTIEM